MAIVIKEFDFPRLIQAIVDDEITVESHHEFVQQIALLMSKVTGLQAELVYCPDKSYGVKIWGHTTYDTESMLQTFDITTRPQALITPNHPLV